MDRVYHKELDTHPDEAACCTWKDEPFTGVAYSTHDDGSVCSEWTFQDGEQWGPGRTRLPNGRLGETHYCLGGLAHGVRRWWRANGCKLAVEVYRFGVLIRSRRWDEDGRVERDYRVEDEEDPHWYLAQAERHRKYVEAEGRGMDLPEEYTLLTDADWNDRPTPHDAPAAT